MVGNFSATSQSCVNIDTDNKRKDSSILSTSVILSFCHSTLHRFHDSDMIFHVNFTLYTYICFLFQYNIDLLLPNGSVIRPIL